MSIRVTSSSSIQSVVSTAMTHLAQPGNDRLLLHTLPIQSGSIPKSSTSALGKLVSIVEIIKREFEQYQRDEWQKADEEEAKRLKRANRKGKKRQREDEHQEQEPAKEAQAEKRTTVERKDRRLLRMYQYNQLDCFERLPVASTSKSDKATNVRSGAEQEDQDDSESEENNTDDGEEPVSALTRGADPAAQNALDAAIRTHVLEKRKRPRKKHTPYLCITLSTTRLPGFEKEQEESKKSYTIQYPPKAKRQRKSRRSKKAGKKQHDDADGVSGEDGKASGHEEEREEGGEMQVEQAVEEAQHVQKEAIATEVATVQEQDPNNPKTGQSQTETTAASST